MAPSRVVLLLTMFLGLAACHSDPPPTTGTGTPPVLPFVFGEGFYKEEVNQSATFRWARQNANLRVTAPAAGRYKFTFRPITVFSPRQNTIEISVNGEKSGQAAASACDFANPQPTSLTLTLQAGTNDVTLKSATAEVRLGTDDERTPAFGLVLPVGAEKVP